jgi:hypothetical protein
MSRLILFICGNAEQLIGGAAPAFEAWQGLPYFNVQISLHARFQLLKLGSTIGFGVVTDR